MFNSVKRLIRWVGPYQSRLNIGYLFSFFHSLFTSLSIVAAAYGLHLIIQDARGIRPLSPAWVWIMAGCMIFAVLGRFLFSYLRAVFQDSIGYERTAQERIQIGDLLKRVPLGFFDKTSTGELSASVTTDLSFFEMYALKMLDTIVSGYLSIAVIVLFMLFFSPLIAAISVAGILLSSLALYGMALTSRRNTIVHQKAQDDMVSSVLEYIRGIALVKSFSQDGFATARVSAAVRNHKRINIKIERFFACFNALHLLSLKAASSSIVLIASYLTISGQMELAMLLMMCMFSFVMFGSVEAINNATHVMKILDAALDKLERIKAAKVLEEPRQSRSLNQYDISFQNVSFAYDRHPVLKDISFTIPEGSTTAIVGPSGSGKTTIAKLIARFYDVAKGQILIGGVDIRNLTCDHLLQNMSIVFQQVYLFHDTVENNIRFGRPDATMDEIIAAAKSSCSHEFITALPNGYQTVIGDGGSTLSGGEKQRISIARAMLKDAPIVILDEATASIDPENEWLIQEAISNLTSGKTIIVIAHRLATIQNADQILVLNHGQISERGTHDELIKTEGIYHRFWQIRKSAEAWYIPKN